MGNVFNEDKICSNYNVIDCLIDWLIYDWFIYPEPSNLGLAMSGLQQILRKRVKSNKMSTKNLVHDGVKYNHECYWLIGWLTVSHIDEYMIN